MQLKVTTDVHSYTETVKRYARARKMAHSAVVERFAQQANYQCAIKSGVKRANLSKFPLNATADPQKGGKTYKQRFFYAEQASHGVKKGKGGEIIMRPKAYRSYARRRSAKGAMAAGFLKSARDLGLKKRGPRDAQLKDGGSASRSRGVKSNPAAEKPRTYSVNAVKGSYEVGKSPMDRAIAFVIKDSHDYAIKLLDKAGDDAGLGNWKPKTKTLSRSK